MQIALYMRMSTDKQESSVESQQKVLEIYAKAHKMNIVRKYIDEGISGRTAEKRPSFMQMIDDSTKDIFDAVLIYDSSRFARNLEESIVYKSELKRNGVKLVSATEPTLDEDSALITDAMLGALNEMYSRKLSKSVKRGMVHKAQKGSYQTPPPFGYKKENGIMSIIPEEAEIVNRIFELFLEYPSWHSVAVRINELGLPKRSNSSWSSRDVKRMLFNSAYIGNVYYCGQVYNGSHDPIISDDLWKAVQKAIDKKPKRKYRPPSSYKHWLSGILKCGQCGSLLTHAKDKRGSRFYRCSGNANGRCKYSNLMSIGRLEKLVKDALENLVANNDLKDYEEFVTIRNDMSKVELLQSYLKKVRQRLVRHKEAYSAGIDTLMEYKENKERYQKEEQEILNQIQVLSQNEFDEDSFKRLEHSAAELIELLFSELQDDEKKSIAIKELIEKIVFDKYTGEFTVYYYL